MRDAQRHLENRMSKTSAAEPNLSARAQRMRKGREQWIVCVAIKIVDKEETTPTASADRKNVFSLIE